MGTKPLPFVLSLVVLLVAGCAGQGAPTPAPGAAPAASVKPAGAAPAVPAKTAKLRLILPKEPPGVSLHPLFGSPAMSDNEPIMTNLREPLVRVGKDGKPVGVLATKWEPSPDLTKWRFYLRRGVKFHNGDDFTARDIVEQAKWALDQKASARLYTLVPIEEAVAVDDYTVDLVFKNPQPLLLTTILQFQVVPAAVSRDKREVPEGWLVGTGPYKVVEWRKAERVTLTRFQDWWGPRPQIDDVEFTFRAEAGVRLAALQAREADWTSELSSDVASLAPQVVRAPSPETVWLRPDEYVLKELGGESILADKRLRLAVEYAINREALVALYQGFATPSQGQFASPGDFGYDPNLKSRPYDLEKARVLVREAGAVGKTVSINGAVDRWTKDREVAQAVANMIEQTGLKVKLMLTPQAEAIKYRFTTGENRPYMVDMTLGPTDALLEVQSRFQQIFTEGGSFSATSDPEPTRLYRELTAERDLAKREEKLAKAWAYAYEESHFIPLFKQMRIWGLAKNLQWDPGVAGTTGIADIKFSD
ncbi:MAG: hypothetical protein HY675_01970 [Chloroflexi bacterium]|nr:hypothetical protein [Chloroflexota bacterium]